MSYISHITYTHIYTDIDYIMYLHIYITYILFYRESHNMYCVCVHLVKEGKNSKANVVKCSHSW